MAFMTRPAPFTIAIDGCYNREIRSVQNTFQFGSSNQAGVGTLGTLSCPPHTNTDLKQSEDNPALIGHHLEQRVEARAVRRLAVRRAQREREEVEEGRDDERARPAQLQHSGDLL